MGISIGFMLMVLGVGFGLGELFKAWPPLYSILRYVGLPTCCTWHGRSPLPGRSPGTPQGRASP